MALSYIQKLYAIESFLKEKSADEKYSRRQQQVKAQLASFRNWLEKSVRNTPPKSLLGVAIQYSLNQWDKLVRYLEDDRLSIDNNRAERAIKPFVIGRKNWLHISEHSDQSFRDYPITHFGLNRSLIPRLSDHF